MKLLQAKIEAGIIKNESDGSGARSSDAGAKHPKLLSFQDGRDDIDIRLTRFERFAESNGWSREKRSSSLCALLTGRALDCYGRLSAEQAKDYDKVKEALMTEDGYRRKFRTCKQAEGLSPDMFIVRILTYLHRWIELSKTDKSYEKLKDLIVREQFMDACPEDLATSLREKDLPTLERVAKEADLFLKARNRKLCDQPRKVFQGNARPRMDSVRPLEPEKRFNGGQRAWEAKTSVADQRSCFKCKKTGHIARYCTAVDSTGTTKKAGAGVVVKATEVNTAEVRKPAESPTMEVTGDLQSEVEGGMLKLASGKSVPVMTNCAALRDPEKTRSLGLPVLKEEIGGREVDVMPDTGCEGVVVRKQLIDESQLTERQAGVGREQLIQLQQEDPRILALVDAGRTLRRGGKVISFEKARGIVYRRYEDLGRNVDVKQVVLPKPLPEYVMSVAHDSITGAHLGIRRTKVKVLSNFYWAGVDGDVTSRLGVPEEVLSDQGTQFISDCMREICRLLGIKQKTTTPYHPMCNGLVERFNATLKTCLRRMCNEQPRQWHRYINPLLFAYREGYIARDQDASQAITEERPPTNSLAIPAASVTVIEDLEGEPDSDCEALPELGGWGSKETVNDLKFGDELTLDQRRQLEEVALMYSSIFSDRPGTASTEEHCIELTSSIPVRQRPYPVPYAMSQTLRDELREIEDLGVIRKSSFPYASPEVVVKKKDGTNRVCIDYRRLNKLTIFDPQPMTPRADIFQSMEKDQCFSKIDLSKGYWQIPVRKEDIPKTAFVTMDCHYEFLRMPFGMMNSGPTLTRAVKKLLCGMDNVVDYIDDLLIHTKTWEAHVKTLSELFKRLQEANFTVRPVKCLLGSRAVEKVRNAPRPKTKREVRAFLGLVGYYKEFVPNFAAVSAPLSDLVRKGQPNVVNWGDSQERACNSLKVAVTSKPALQLPDVNKKFVLRTDASDRGLGAALMQENEGTLFPVAYASKKLTDRERKYSVTEREALAIVRGVKTFLLYLYGTVFILQTDHGALQFLNAAKFDSPRIMRWAVALQVYNFDVQYIKGSENPCHDIVFEAPLFDFSVDSKSEPKLVASTFEHIKNAKINLKTIDNLHVQCPPLWEEHKINVDISLAEQTKENTREGAYQKEFFRMKEKFSNHYAVYTDGSKREERVAAAAYFPDRPDRSKATRLRDGASVFSAEPQGIALGLTEI
ncbi:Zinc finger protein [Plakobranchus ocellatus]|uniref:Zinc finger protein n=1 Tax=Plakobranchus ocellatus TaxID=259542 RepID=A0AAV4C7R3_9GAST|nr:Zinc finger protein [Plakobranchus ocellatus]